MFTVSSYKPNGENLTSNADNLEDAKDMARLDVNEYGYTNGCYIHTPDGTEIVAEMWGGKISMFSDDY